MQLWQIYVGSLIAGVLIVLWRILNRRTDPWILVMRLFHVHMHDWETLSEDADNVTLVCRTCHSQKSTRK